jgi:hypothetical protein
MEYINGLTMVYVDITIAGWIYWFIVMVNSGINRL